MKICTKEKKADKKTSRHDKRPRETQQQNQEKDHFSTTTI